MTHTFYPWKLGIIQSISKVIAEHSLVINKRGRLLKSLILSVLKIVQNKKKIKFYRSYNKVILCCLFSLGLERVVSCYVDSGN